MCGKTKPLSDFCKNRRRSDGYDYKCKECNNKITRDWRKKNPEKCRETCRNNSRKYKGQIEEILGTKCVVCGSRDKIECHEIYGKKHPTNSIYILNHIEDFVCLCHWCHSFVHHLIIAKKNVKDLNLEELSEIIKRRW